MTILNSVLQSLSLILVIILTASLLQAFFVMHSVACFPCFCNFAVWCFFLNLASILQASLLKQNIDLALLVYKTWGWDTFHTN
jgi:hypothetical protein